MLEGLKLAAQDEARGMITRERAAEMTRSLLQVIDDLCDHVDVAPRDPAAHRGGHRTRRPVTPATPAIWDSCDNRHRHRGLHRRPRFVR